MPRFQEARAAPENRSCVGYFIGGGLMAVRKTTQKPLVSRGPVDAPGKRHRKPPPQEPLDKRMGEPVGKQMGQKSARTAGRRGVRR